MYGGEGDGDTAGDLIEEDVVIRACTDLAECGGDPAEAGGGGVSGTDKTRTMFIRAEGVGNTVECLGGG